MVVSRFLIALFFVVGSPAAVAHHPLQGRAMETFGHGLLSGIGHPLLGFDHLFFIVAMGLGAALCRPRAGLISAYLVAMAGGCLLRMAMPAVPLNEWLIAASLLVVGGMLALVRLPGAGSLGLLFAVFGLCHGLAFGDSIATAEALAGGRVVAGYLAGLVFIQWLVAWLAGAGAMRQRTDTGVRLAGAMVAGVGLFLLLEASEPALLALIV